MAFGLVEATGLGVFWWWGPIFVFAIMPVLDTLDRQGRGEPAGRRRSSTSRRTATTAGAPTLFLPLQYASLVVGVRAVGERRPEPGRVARPGASPSACVSGIAINTAHELGHKRKQRRALAVEGRARADRLRPLLHRAQPRSPRARRDAGGPGQLAAGGELLARSCRAPSPAASRRRGSSSASACERDGARVWSAAQRHPQRVGDDRRRCSASLTAVFGSGVLPVPAAPGGLRLLAARGRQLPRALRPAAPEARRTAATSAREPRHSWNSNNVVLQRAALPPAAPLRPPRQPDAPLPGAAPLRRGAGAAVGLRDDDPARLLPAALAPGDGPEGARALRRRPVARQRAPPSAKYGC